MSVIIAVLYALAVPPGDAEALAATYPNDLTLEAAQAHLVAARLASAVYGVDIDLVLAIAWHESRFTDAVSREPGNRVSCGPMTPEPIARCPHDGLVGGYLRGTRHLRRYLDSFGGDVHATLLAYAGGRGLVRKCWDDPPLLVNRGDHVFDVCSVADVFLHQRWWIRWNRSHSRRITT